MKRTLILSQPIFDEAMFRPFAEKIAVAGSRVFVINYANEPRMLKIRFNRVVSVEKSEQYRSELIEKLTSFGIKTADIIFSNDGDTIEDFMTAYNKSDLLIFCGGAPENLLDKLEELAVTNLIANTQKPIIAYSAGAEVLLDNLLLLPSSFWIDAGNYYKGYAKRRAVGRIHELILSFHYTSENIKWLQEAVKFRKHTLYALTDYGGLYCEDDKIFWIGEHAVFLSK